MSAENKKNENVEVSKDTLTDSFNKHFKDYLDRYGTNRTVAEPETAPETNTVGSETTEPVSDFGMSSENDDLFYVPETEVDASSELDGSSQEDSADIVDPDAVSDEEDGISDEAQEEASTSELEQPEMEVDSPETPSEDESEDQPSDDLTELGDEEDHSPVAETSDIEDDDEDFFFTPTETASIEDDDEELGFYEPERRQEEDQQVEEPQSQPQQQVVEREVVREVLVVDRDQARDLGYSADSYLNQNGPVTPSTHQPSPAPVRNDSAPVTPAPSSRPTTPPPAPSVHVVPTPAPAPRRDYSEPVARPVEKSGGFFSNLFGKKEKGSSTDVDSYVSNVRDYQERSRIREEGMDADFSGSSDDSVISLRTQADYDPREERRRLQHVSAEQRDVDPANWLEQTMLDALQKDASDLHITVDGETKNLRARIRVDGQMQDFDYVTGIPARVIMGRLKAATKLSSGGSFAPEETIYEIELDGEKRKARAVLFRVEDGGEALVMRLPLTGSLRQLNELAFSDMNLQHVYDLLAMPYKLIMIAGPMGSGKTTTAHGALLHVADQTRTVWTIEDPVERRLPNLVQLEIDEENGAGFDVLLSKLLRADYNTLFLGEIRDNATAAAAVRQAKAGRQVMSTIHADDNIKSLMRLIELAGDSPMSVLSAVGGVISQRLVRRLNPEWDGVDPAKKYKGRIPIHEILFVNDNIVEVMMQDRPLSDIKQAVRNAKGSTFADDARRLIAANITDREEIVKVIGEYDAEDRY